MSARWLVAKLHLIQQTAQTELSQALRSHFTTTHLNSLQTHGSVSSSSRRISFWWMFIDLFWYIIARWLLPILFYGLFDFLRSRKSCTKRIFNYFFFLVEFRILTLGIWSWETWDLEFRSHATQMFMLNLTQKSVTFCTSKFLAFGMCQRKPFARSFIASFTCLSSPSQQSVFFARNSHRFGELFFRNSCQLS